MPNVIRTLPSPWVVIWRPRINGKQHAAAWCRSWKGECIVGVFAACCSMLQRPILCFVCGPLTPEPCGEGPQSVGSYLDQGPRCDE